MAGKFTIGQIVIYEKRAYIITQCHLLNDFMEFDPFVYGLVALENYGKFNFGYFEPDIYVREALLRAATEKEIKTWKTLFGG